MGPSSTTTARQSQKRSALGWDCAQCTFHHNLPSNRCAMCGQLRNASAQQMHDFVLGKSVPASQAESNPTSTSIETEPVVPEMMKGKENSNFGATATIRNNNQTQNRSKPVIRNPYSKASSIVKPQVKPVSSTMDNCSNGATNSNTTPLHPSAPPPQSPSRVPPNSATIAGDTLRTANPAACHPKIINSINPVANPAAAPASINALTQLKPPPTKFQRTNSKSAKATKPATRQKAEKTPFTMAKAASYAPGPVAPCPDASKTWIYPKHPDYPTRQYQLEITESAILYNTLVSLPTGLGKTLIAAVVMYNYYRWFPTGKIVFLAPTLPLVQQQVQACYKVMGIPATDTAVMTGRVAANQRLEYWKKRRVFYCTPQTVQKDLAGPGVGSFADQVVCLVLDEAHKATGEYAYVKVVEQLEEAGAKFRICGLSATPGTTIKAIQQVVQALRSARIEARHEGDATVQPYLHQKHSEIVVVPKNDSQKEVERLLSNMIQPILERLRSEGAIRLSGNATLTAYQIFQAKNDYTKRMEGQVPGNILGSYAAAYKLIELRTDSHQSLGMVKTKMLRLKNEPQRGMLSNIVKSNAFQELLQMLVEATNPSQESVSGPTTRNNPKLEKLSEILHEHFSRAQACEKSSRAIVFSQFRDSVSEIVALLRTRQPLIRARHFVGQGKPPKGSSNGTNGKDSEIRESTMRLGGMKQKEQHQVIQQFRSNDYNVLVCTCIGEEGLDIGEVDLIINYDTLRSPIRMIQRTGRTGRQRDGRVVCLVAEGQEERTYLQSKQAEKTLARALEKKSNFNMLVPHPMLPTPPQREDIHIQVTSQLRMSQVAGVHTSSMRTSNSKPNRKTFQLAEKDEAHRQQVMGDVAMLDSNEVPWNTLRRVLARGRSDRGSRGGRVVGILRTLDCLGATSQKPHNLKESRGNSAIHKLFPLYAKPDEKQEVRQTLEQAADQQNPQKPVESAPPVATHQELLPARNQEPRVQVRPAAINLPCVNPYAVGGKSERVSGVVKVGPTTGQDKGPQRTLLPETAAHADKELTWSVAANPIARAQQASVTETANAMNGDAAKDDQQESIASNDLHFRLPTPPPSSSSSEDGDESDEDKSLPDEVVNVGNLGGVQAAAPKSPTAVPRAAVGLHPSPPQDESPEVSFLLPTQSSSSEDESDADDVPSRKPAVRAEVPLQTEREPCNKFHKAVEANVAQPSATNPSNISARNDPLNAQSKDSINDDNREHIPTSGTANTSLASHECRPPTNEKDDDVESPRQHDSGYVAPENSANSYVDNPQEQESQSPILRYRANPRKRRQILEDDDNEEHIPSQRATATCRTSQESYPPTAKHDDVELPKAHNLESGAPGNSLRSDVGIPQEQETQSPILRYRANPEKRRQILDDDCSQASPKGMENIVNGLEAVDETPCPRVKRPRVNVLDDTPDGTISNTVMRPPSSSSVPRAGLASLTDTPLTAGLASLTDTPLTNGHATHEVGDQEDIVCSICFSGDSPDEDPIILCDGHCNLAFHQSCYGAAEVDIDSDEPWLCDMCSIGGQAKVVGTDRCGFCSAQSGPLKRFTASGFYHPVCALFRGHEASRSCVACSKDGGVRCFSCTAAAHPFCAIDTPGMGLWTVVLVDSSSEGSSPKCALFCPTHTENVTTFLGVHAESRDGGDELPTIKVIQSRRPEKDGRQQNRRRLKRAQSDAKMVHSHVEAESAFLRSNSEELSRVKRRRQVLSKYVLNEAGIASDEDADGDDAESDEIRRLEDDELSHDSFINDATELTQHFSQDLLAGIDPDAVGEVDFEHRALDAQKIRDEQFKTPILNRRMKLKEDSQLTSSSQKGLGNMHFIRSVLEHHRDGGRSEEIEQLCNELEQAEEESPDLSNHEVPEQPARIIINCDDSSDDNEDSPVVASSTTANVTNLTNEQRERIKRNRLEALQRQEESKRCLA